MDVTSSALNLTTALVNFSSGGALVNGTQAIYRWIERERLDTKIFDLCCSVAHSLAFPNRFGSLLQKQVERSDNSIVTQVRRTPLKIVTSGCLGRLIGRDENLRWMVTTVATLDKFQNTEYATDVICAMMLLKRGRDEPQKYRHERAPLKAVIVKIVDSIFLNSSNSGHSLRGLPPELSCLADGVLAAESLASIIVAIQNSDGDCMIYSDHFLSSLTLWLFYHFDGKLEVIVEGTVLLEEVVLGQSDRKISLIVKKRYLRTATVSSHVDKGKVGISISGNSTPLAGVSYETHNEPQLQSYQRHDLYEFPRYKSDRPSGFWGVTWMFPFTRLNKDERYRIEQKSAVLLNWMLRLEVAPVTESRLPMFDAYLTKGKKNLGGSHRKFLTLFKCYPKLLQDNADALLGSENVYRPAGTEEQGDHDDDVSMGPPEVGLRQPRSSKYSFIAAAFPIVQDLLESLRRRCTCPQCDDDSDHSLFKDGCLQTSGIEQLLLFLAHGLSDAMGIKNVSGRYDYHDVVDGMVSVFHDLLKKGHFEWDPIFEVVACLTLGISSSQLNSDKAEEYSAWCAAQAGSLLVVADWLSLEKEFGSSNFFSLEVIEGAIQEIPDDIGMLRCEAMHINDKDLDGEHSDDEDLPTEVLSDWRAGDTIDHTDFKIESPVFRVFDGTYRLMTAVRCGRKFRMIDPVLVQIGALNCLQPRCRCKHREAAGQISFNRNVEISGFDKAIAEWSSHSKKATIEASKVLLSPVQLSTLLSLSLDGCVIRDVEECCARCALDALAKYGPRECWRILNVQRRRTKRTRLLTSTN